MTKTIFQPTLAHIRHIRAYRLGVTDAEINEGKHWGTLLAKWHWSIMTFYGWKWMIGSPLKSPTQGDVHSTFQTWRSCLIYLPDENPAKIPGPNEFWTDSKWVDRIWNWDVHWPAFRNNTWFIPEISMTKGTPPDCNCSLYVCFLLW